MWDNRSTSSAGWGLWDLGVTECQQNLLSIDFFSLAQINNGLTVQLYLPLEIIESYPDLYTAYVIT